MPRLRPLAATGVALLLALAVVGAQAPAAREPGVQLTRSTALSLPGPADSNSPAVWEIVNGVPTLHVLTSVDGFPNRATGRRLGALSTASPVRFTDPAPLHGVWMEAVIADVDGTWYGYYHNQIPAEAQCGDSARVTPRIGAARSTDHGVTWVDLGVVLEAPSRSHVCASQNRYFVGGVGDFSVVLDHESRDVYVFYSSYVSRDWGQGVSVARMAWADRDAPVGRMSTYTRGIWLPAREFTLDESGQSMWYYPVATPVYRTAQSWHLDGPSTDAFWGPSVHWNTHLEQWVMLLNRASDMTWKQEGIYVAFSPTLEDPSQWTTPRKILNSGQWYPQVLGTEVGAGTDRLAGAVARLFLGGRSDYLIQFTR